MSRSPLWHVILRWVPVATILLFAILLLLIVGGTPAFAGPPDGSPAPLEVSFIPPAIYPGPPHVDSAPPAVYLAQPPVVSGPPDSVRRPLPASYSAAPDYPEGAVWRASQGGADLPGLFGQPIPNPGFTTDLTYDAFYGFVAPYDVVSVLRTADGAYGSAEADGVGFFWLIPYDGAGRPTSVNPGDTFELRVNGVLAATLQSLDITGYLDVIGDDVLGTIPGLAIGTPVTVTLGEGPTMLADEPRVVTLIADGAGNFSADFTGIAGIGPQMMAQVEYRDAAGNTVLAHVYPSDVFRLLNMSSIQGFAVPGATVAATVYITYPTDVRWAGTVEARWPHGWFSFGGVWAEPGDVVEVDMGSGAPPASLDVECPEARPDAATNQILGWAPPGAMVRAYVWSSFDGLYAEDTAIAQPDGSYTITLPADLETRHWPYVG
ncbi:MAG TPA: hypothetical protein VLC95_13280 [Anaerolineae bacterium]|nr:hypothetical protein [Anaerolineae bacterium]